MIRVLILNIINIRILKKNKCNLIDYQCKIYFNPYNMIYY